MEAQAIPDWLGIGRESKPITHKITPTFFIPVGGPDEVDEAWAWHGDELAAVLVGPRR
jgi:hypothetical protein